MIVTKLDAARHQLQTAIELWIEDRDPVSVHTLAYAAYQIIHDLNRHAKGPTLLLDSEEVKPTRRQEFINAVKSAAVFFKHADDRSKGKKKGRNKITPSSSIDFNPAMVESFFAYSILGIEYLKQERFDHEVTFMVWYSVQHPQIITDEVILRRNDFFNHTNIEQLRKFTKAEFFKHFLHLPAV
jgi:hypothetical protein